MQPAEASTSLSTWPFTEKELPTSDLKELQSHWVPSASGSSSHRLSHSQGPLVRMPSCWARLMHPVSAQVFRQFLYGRAYYSPWDSSVNQRGKDLSLHSGWRREL